MGKVQAAKIPDADLDHAFPPALVRLLFCSSKMVLHMATAKIVGNLVFTFFPSRYHCIAFKCCFPQPFPSQNGA